MGQIKGIGDRSLPQMPGIDCEANVALSINGRTGQYLPKDSRFFYAGIKCLMAVYIPCPETFNQVVILKSLSIWRVSCRGVKN